MVRSGVVMVGERSIGIVFNTKGHICKLKSKSKCSKSVNNCGRPGVNGGYFDNPNIKFGVNCYGQKPDAERTKTFS